MKFSQEEFYELAKGLGGISLAFGFLLSRGNLLSLAEAFFISMVTVGSGFVLHELAHKYFAQKYGCAAEFRAFNSLLILAIFMSLFFGFVFAAPGAVFIRGMPGLVRNGRISAAGPITNIVLVYVFIAVFFLAPAPFIQVLGLYGALINALLGAFNMIPVLNFDGAKVFKWNKTVYWAVSIAAIASYLLVGAIGQKAGASLF